MAKHHQRHQRQPARAARTRARRLTTGGACGQVGRGSIPPRSRTTRAEVRSIVLRQPNRGERDQIKQFIPEGRTNKISPCITIYFCCFLQQKARAGKRTAFCAIWEPEGACGGPIGTPTSPFERDQKNRGFDTPGAPRVEARLTVH